MASLDEFIQQLILFLASSELSDGDLQRLHEWLKFQDGLEEIFNETKTIKSRINRSYVARKKNFSFFLSRPESEEKKQYDDTLQRVEFLLRERLGLSVYDALTVLAEHLGEEPPNPKQGFRRVVERFIHVYGERTVLSAANRAFLLVRARGKDLDWKLKE